MCHSKYYIVRKSGMAGYKFSDNTSAHTFIDSCRNEKKQNQRT